MMVKDKKSQISKMVSLPEIIGLYLPWSFQTARGTEIIH